MTILEILDEGGSRKAFNISGAGARTYSGSYLDYLPVAAEKALASGYTYVISIQKRTGMIPDGKEWEAWVSGATSGGPFRGSLPTTARIQAEEFIRGLA
jgi:hypothetical protein